MSANNEVKPRLYFYHIPKTSGTSSLYYLQSIFGATDVYLGGVWDSLITNPREDLKNFRVYWGHFMGMFDSYAKIDSMKMTLLRDPLDRTVSHYLHVQRSPEHPLHRIVSMQSLRAFVTDPKTSWMVTNYQAMYLLKWHLDVEALYRGFEPSSSPGLFQQELESLPLPGLSETTLFDVSSRRLKAFFRADTAERCSQAMQELASTVKRPLALTVPRQRERPASQALPYLDREVIRLIERATRVDRALYEIVRESPIRNGDWSGDSA